MIIALECVTLLQYLCTVCSMHVDLELLNLNHLSDELWPVDPHPARATRLQSSALCWCWFVGDCESIATTAAEKVSLIAAWRLQPCGPPTRRKRFWIYCEYTSTCTAWRAFHFPRSLMHCFWNQRRLLPKISFYYQNFIAWSGGLGLSLCSTVHS